MSPSLKLSRRRGFHYEAQNNWLFLPPAQRLLDDIKRKHRCRSFLWCQLPDETAALRASWHARGCDAPQCVWLPSPFLTTSASSLSPEQRSADTPARTSTRIQWLMNAAFIEDTDLFLFLISHPLPDDMSHRKRMPKAGPVEPGFLSARAVFRDGAWAYLDADGVTTRWLQQGQRRVQLQLDYGCAVRETFVSQDSRTSPTAWETSREDSYLLSMMVPPERAGARGTPHLPFKADACWVDEPTTSRFQLACFPDAFYVPCEAASHSAASVPLHRPARITRGAFFCNMDFCDS